jgi:hypothetical protein
MNERQEAQKWTDEFNVVLNNINIMLNEVNIKDLNSIEKNMLKKWRNSVLELLKELSNVCFNTSPTYMSYKKMTGEEIKVSFQNEERSIEEIYNAATSLLNWLIFTYLNPITIQLNEIGEKEEKRKFRLSIGLSIIISLLVGMLVNGIFLLYTGNNRSALEAINSKLQTIEDSFESIPIKFDPPKELE